MAGARCFSSRLTLLLAGASLAAAGCQVAPRQQLDQCHKLSQTLRSENAQLKDQMLVLRSQNEDFSERAVDDARRLAQLEESNQQLEISVQAYQDERSRLESAYKELLATLPGSVRPLSMARPPDDRTEPLVEPRSAVDHDPSVKRAEEPGGAGPDERSDRRRTAAHGRDAWVPAGSSSTAGESAAATPARSGP